MNRYNHIVEYFSILINKFNNKLKSLNLYFLFLLILFVLFSVYFSYYALMRYYSLNADIFDLGVAMQHASDFITYKLTSFSIIWNPIIWIVFPLFIFKSYPLILVFQAVMVTFTAIPLYKIGEIKFKGDSQVALLISFSYILSPLLVGSYLYDFHFQALFPAFFVLGYYYLLKGKTKPAIVFFIFSGITRYPYMLFVILLSVVLIFQKIYNQNFLKQSNSDGLRFKSLFTLLFISTGIILFQFSMLTYITSGINSAISTSNVFLGSSLSNSLFLDFQRKLSTLLFLFGPLLLIPLLSRKFLILYFPYLFILASSNKYQFMLPAMPGLQYDSLIIPFLFLGLIDALTQNKCHKTKDLNLINHPKIPKSFLLNLKRKVVLTIFISSILFAAVYQPYGPLNNDAGQLDYHIAGFSHANFTEFNDLIKIIAYIPKSNPYVLVQYNLPQYYPASLPYNFTFMNVAFFLYNLSLYKHYMLLYEEDTVIYGPQHPDPPMINAKIDYILADINSSLYQYRFQNIPNCPDP